jgi:hypothetical protein
MLTHLILVSNTLAYFRPTDNLDFECPKQFLKDPSVNGSNLQQNISFHILRQVL